MTLLIKYAKVPIFSDPYIPADRIYICPYTAICDQGISVFWHFLCSVTDFILNKVPLGFYDEKQKNAKKVYINIK